MKPRTEGREGLRELLTTSLTDQGLFANSKPAQIVFFLCGHDGLHFKDLLPPRRPALAPGERTP